MRNIWLLPLRAKLVVWFLSFAIISSASFAKAKEEESSKAVVTDATKNTKDKENPESASESASKDSKASADHHKEGDHKVHAAHTHGEATMKVAVDKGKVMLEVHTPLESLVGFEYQAKTEAEKKAVEAAKKTYVASQLFAFAKELSCTEVSSSSHFHYEKEHAEAKVAAEYACKGLGSGKTLTVKLVENFPKLKKVHVEMIPLKGSASKVTYTSKTVDIKL